jgi:transmembrane sensor
MSSQDERRAQPTEEAAAWLLQLESGALSAEGRAKFADWLRESPVHVAEMLRVSRLQQALKQFAQRGLIPPLDSTIPTNVTALSTRKDIRRSQPRHITVRPWVAIAASLAAVAVLTTVLLNRSGSMVAETQPGERRDLSLADGSEITIAPNSKLHIQIGGKERLIVLERGEALFHVGKDLNHPFIVDAGGARTRDVGTAFSVARHPDAVVVTVVEGRVEVIPAKASGHFDVQDGGEVHSISLGSDEQVAVSTTTTAVHVRKVSSQVEVGWAQGQLVFDNNKVADIVRRFNQYNRVQIRIVDDVLASRSITGVFRADDPKSFVEFLQSEAGATARQTSNDEIIVGAFNAAPVKSSSH